MASRCKYPTLFYSSSLFLVISLTSLQCFAFFFLFSLSRFIPFSLFTEEIFVSHVASSGHIVRCLWKIVRSLQAGGEVSAGFLRVFFPPEPGDAVDNQRRRLGLVSQTPSPFFLLLCFFPSSFFSLFLSCFFTFATTKILVLEWPTSRVLPLYCDLSLSYLRDDVGRRYILESSTNRLFAHTRTDTIDRLFSRGQHFFFFLFKTSALREWLA